MYVTSDVEGNFSTAFDFGKVPVVTREQADADERTRYVDCLYDRIIGNLWLTSIQETHLCNSNT